VNNAVHWAAVEEAMAGRVPERGGLAVEMEYRAALEADDHPQLAVVRRDTGVDCWLETDGVARASAKARWSCGDVA
jgi:hypothetical protein